jgi:hypothetical protein
MGARAGGDTLQGRQAYGVLTWVYEDPEARAAEGRTRVAELARQATGAALREIQDVGTILSRLAGAVQFAGIADQVFDLSRPPTWVNEKRNTHGEWTRGGSGTRTISSQVSADVRLRAAHQRMAASRAQSAAPTPDIEKIAKQHAASVVAEATAEMKAEQRQIVGEVVAKVQAVNAKLEATKEEAESESKHKHRVKLAVEGLLAIGSGIIALISAKMGAPEAVSVLAPVAPFILQAVIEFLKRL